MLEVTDGIKLGKLGNGLEAKHDWKDSLLL